MCVSRNRNCSICIIIYPSSLPSGILLSFICAPSLVQYCPEVIPDIDGNAISECDPSVRTGGQCTPTCGLGYKATNVKPYTCGAKSLAQWSGGSITCIGVEDCGALSGLSLATANCTKTRTNDYCSAQCAPGYEETANSVNKYFCDIEGKWTQGNIQCRIKDCGSFVAPSPFSTSIHSFQCSASTTFGSKCTGSCLPGYSQVGASVPFTCSAQGVWSGGSVQCQIKDCGNFLTAIEGTSGLVEVNSCPATTFGSSCSAKCKTGYRPTQLSVASFTCDADAVWRGSFACEAITCDLSSGLPQNALFTECDSNVFGDSCSPTCKEGFVSSTSSSPYTCSLSQSWEATGQPLVCTPVMCQSLVIADPLIRLTCTGTTFDSSCVATCAPGYELTPSSQSTYRCASDQTWVGGSVACQRKTCPALVVPGANHSCVNSKFGDKCVVTCNIGFTKGKITSATYSCDASGSWAGSLVCELITCKATIDNLPSYALSTCVNKSYGDKCEAVCRKGRTLYGDTSYTCGADGLWKGGCPFNCTGEIQKKKYILFFNQFRV
jgi:hypothetical protein